MALRDHKSYYTVLRVGHNWLTQHRAGWDEDCYRDLLMRNGAECVNGKFSAKTMNIMQLEAALTEMKVMGFKPKRKRQRQSGSKRVNDPRVSKLNAMWIAMHEAGVVRDRSERAMQKWCENQVPELTKFQWIDNHQLNQAVEMMKQMASHHGVKAVALF